MRRLLYATMTAVPMLLAFAVNGFFQSTGWPGNVKAMQPFFSAGQRGRVMGIWTTNYQAGGLAATALATFLLVATLLSFWPRPDDPELATNTQPPRERQPNEPVPDDVRDEGEARIGVTAQHARADARRRRGVSLRGVPVRGVPEGGHAKSCAVVRGTFSCICPK
mgnify:CR=1 FL=1